MLLLSTHSDAPTKCAESVNPETSRKLTNHRCPSNSDLSDEATMRSRFFLLKGCAAGAVFARAGVVVTFQIRCGSFDVKEIMSVLTNQIVLDIKNSISKNSIEETECRNMNISN